MRKPKHNTGEWFPQGLIARFFGVSVTLFSREIRPLIADADVRKGDGGRIEVRGPAAVEARYQKRLELELSRLGITLDDEADLLASGKTSPALEECRKWRAKKERLAYETAAGRVVDIDQVRDLLTRTAARLRSAGEQLQRIYGSDAQAVLDEAIDDIARMELDRGPDSIKNA